MAKRGIVKNRKSAQGNTVGMGEQVDKGQDAEQHSYPMLPQKRIEKVFAINTKKGKGSPLKSSIGKNK